MAGEAFYKKKKIKKGKRIFWNSFRMEKFQEEERKERRAQTEGELPSVMPDRFPSWNKHCKREAGFLFYCVDSNWGKMNHKEKGELNKIVLRGCKQYLEHYVSCMQKNSLKTDKEDEAVITEYEESKKNEIK